jgi:hypothetical protein
MEDVNTKSRMLGGTLVISPEQGIVFQRRETKRFEHVTPVEVLDVCKRLGNVTNGPCAPVPADAA